MRTLPNRTPASPWSKADLEAVSFRVLHVLDHSWPVLDGYAQRSRSIIKAQSEIGMLPRVVTGPLHEIDDPASEEITLDDIRYSRSPIGDGMAARAIRQRWPVLREFAVVRTLRRRLESLLAAEHFDLMHAHSPALCGLAAWQASRATHTPFVYEIRSFWEDSDLAARKSAGKRLRYRLSRDLETFVVRRAGAVIGISRSILQDLQQRNIPDSKLYCVPNGVDASRFMPRPRDAALTSSLQLDGVPTLGFLGTFFPWEGVPWLVRAAAKLHETGVKFKLLIIGDGAEASNVRRAIAETSSGAFVSYLGRIANADVERYYSVMDVLVYPRRKVRIAELVTPLKPLEAMAAGKAVLGSDVGGIRELVDPEVTGLLFSPEDISDFCSQAERLLRNAALRDSLGNRARQKMLEDRDWRVLARGYESAYRAAAVGRDTKHPEERCSEPQTL